MTTITYYLGQYVVTRPCGTQIKCHNLPTALYYKRNPEAK